MWSRDKSKYFIFTFAREKAHKRSSLVTYNMSCDTSITPSRDNYLFADNVALFNIKHNVYRNSCFPSTIIDWNNLDSNLCNSKNVGIFKSSILKLINNCCNLKGIRLMTRLRLEFSHLREHRFKYNPAVGSVHLFHF